MPAMRPKASATSSLPRDTHLSIHALQIAAYRRMDAQQKVELIHQLWELDRELALAGIRLRHPDASAMQIRQYLAEALLGKAIAQKLYANAGSPPAAPR